MQNQKEKNGNVDSFGSCLLTFTVVSGLFFSLIGCVSQTPSKPIELRLKSEVGRTEVVHYHTHSVVKTFAADQIAREKYDEMDFKAKTKTTKIDEKKNIHQVVSVFEKDGFMNLHDMAFPELDESIEMIFTPLAEVEKAGLRPKGGIFYVPPISLPENPVAVGETWTMKSRWISSHNGLKMELDLVSILKRLVPCAQKDLCADLEVSGQVHVPQLKKSPVQIESQIKGRILFAVNAGTVLWSEIRNKDKIKTGDELVEIEACLESLMTAPADYLIKKELIPDCKVTTDGGSKAAVAVPI